MRPATTLVKSALGSALHATDLARDAARRQPPPGRPDGPAFTIAAIAYWYVPSRSEYVIRTIEGLRRQRGDVSIAIITNDPTAAMAGLGDLGTGVPGFGDVSSAAAHLLANPGSIASLTWSPARRRTHPYELTWGHKALMRSIALEHRGFDNGLSHLVYLEDDLEFPAGAFDYWVAARAVLEPFGLIPSFTRWEGRDGDRRISDVQFKVRLSKVPVVEAPLATGADADALWVNLPNPYQACFLLDAPLAMRHLTTSRFLSPARSLSGSQRWGRDLGLRERASIGPIGDDVPSGFKTKNVVPVVPSDGPPQLLPECLVEHQPAPGYFQEGNLFARIPLPEVFVDDRAPDRATHVPD